MDVIALLSPALGISIALLTLALLYYMLIARSAAWAKGSQRVFHTSNVAAVIPTPARRGTRHTTFQNFSAGARTHASLKTRTSPQALQAIEMLRGAVEKHEKENTLQQQHSAAKEQKSLSQTLFPSSQTSQQYGSQQHTVNRSVANVLKPTPPSTLNRWTQQRSSGFGATKRTASGLQKVVNGAFDDAAGSQSQPIVVGGDGGKLRQGQQSLLKETEFFDEDDFDSDIELDVEEPKNRPSTAYPTLPVPQKPPSTFRSPQLPTAFKPTAARQQQAQVAHAPESSVIDSGYGSLDPSAIGSQAPHGSSAPIPWSSSPDHHFDPPPRPTDLSKFTYGATSTPAQQSQLAQHRAPKRRTLPWQDEQESNRDAPLDSASTVKSRFKPVQTPLSKDNQKSIYPWNTTASAVKEQQKKHRADAKKNVMKIEGTEESLKITKSKRKKVPRVFLSEEQQHVLDLVAEQKKSVFFTGSAGTGKSVLLREIIATLRKRYQKEPDRIAVTASTGLAACNVGGVTLHSFAGIGLGKEDVPELVRKIKKNSKARHRWMRTKVLVIDEVSMVDGELFDKLESIARQLRNNGRPFGGIQVIITGDFFQLPPVPESNGMGARVAKFAFDAATWKTSIEHTIALHHVFRQKDPVFAGMLNEMREGRLTDSSIKAFRSLARPLHYQDMLDATELFPTRSEVDRANTERMSLLQGKTMVFEARDGGSITEKTFRDKLLANCMAPESITVKKGAQVMLIKNIDETLVNGSLGKVIGFMDEATFDKYSTNEGAYSQSPNGTLIDPEDDPSLSVQEKAKARLQEKLIIGPQALYPLVRFSIADGTTRDLLCQPETWKVELPNGEVQASRAQVPLILAWALSIHKAQGQTLDRVKVDLGKVFENGQAYVALSRATSMSGLQVMRFDPKKVTAHERVRKFYANLSRVELEGKDVSDGATGTKVKKTNRGGMTVDEYEQNFMAGKLD